jgi:glycosyltransferase involved in cell wall biosynthesis
MASAAIPVVLNAGGPRELVIDGENGFLWSSTSNLRSRTWDLVKDSDLRAAMATQAKETSDRFDASAFRSRLNELVTDLVGI